MTAVPTATRGPRLFLGLFLIFCIISGISRAYGSAACIAPLSVKNRVKAKSPAQQNREIGEWFADRKQFRCAADSFAAAARLDPASPSLIYLWGLSLYSSGEAAAAIGPLHRSSELDRSDIRPHLVLASAYLDLKRKDDAQSEWRKALSIDPDSAPALDGLSQELIELKDYAAVVALLEKPGRHRSSAQSLNLGIAFADTARLDAAANVLHDGLDTNPDSLPIADELTVVLMLMGRVEEAYAVFDGVLAKHPDDKATQVLYLSTLVTSHSERAPEYAKKLLASFPRDSEVLYLNGMVASGEGDFQQAREFLLQSVSLNPHDHQSQHLLGSTLARLGELPAAKEHLETAIQAGDNQPEVHYELAKVLQRLGDAQASSDQLRAYQQLKSLQSGKTQAAGKAEVADQEMKSGNAAKAASLYREAIDSDPVEPLLHYKLSQALDRVNDIEGERKALDRAIELNPNLAEAQNQVGYIAAHQGDSATAETHLRAAVHASPSFTVAWINLAATLASESKWQDAEEAIKHALALDPENQQALRLRNALAAARPNP